MKKSVLKFFATVCGVVLMSHGLSAQSANEQILSGIENPADYETIQLAQMDPNLSTFMNLVALSDFGVSWKLTDQEHSVLIPTNQAFNEMSIKKFLHLTNPENKADLVRFVKYHFVPNRTTKSEFSEADILSTQTDEQITVSADPTFNLVYVGGAKIIKSLEASDGNIHIVNGVVQPNEDFLSID